MTNALAYNEIPQFTDKKSFITLAPGGLGGLSGLGGETHLGIFDRPGLFCSGSK